MTSLFDMDVPTLNLLTAPGWSDYELLDSGAGARLERYGPYTFVRPEHQAVWRRALPEARWQAAHGVFRPTGDEFGGQWEFRQPVKSPWVLGYKGLRFNAFTANSRHMGFFPEQAAQWDWMVERLAHPPKGLTEKPRLLNLFGYTGLATLAAARAGAQVTHVDASKKSVALARENQALSKLEAAPVRWLVDDAFKFVRREVRRGAQYEGIILDPPKFGRGPQGQVWEFFDGLPGLLEDCRQLLSPQPMFIILTAYAIRASALSIYYALQEMTRKLPGSLEAGELALQEQSAGRVLSMSIYARWWANEQ
ncbi:MAG: class I SAM-dependent methyltransferase [Chloroflexota bacterium]